MNESWKQITWSQFGAAIDALKSAISACPEDLWRDESKAHHIWHIAYHTLFFLDFYLEADAENYAPPKPFTLSELDPAGVLPERVYSQSEVLTFLAYCREKCQKTILQMTEKRSDERFVFGRVDLSIAELALYNLRHVQHHAGQINLLLRLHTGSAPGWVFSATE